MRTLALDIGTRRTGVAYLDDATGIPLPLDTIEHTTLEILLDRVMTLVDERRIDRIVIGLPRLPSGEEGQQAKISRSFGALLEAKKMRVSYIDERHTTPRNTPSKHALLASKIDGDAAAACALLSGKIDH